MSDVESLPPRTFLVGPITIMMHDHILLYTNFRLSHEATERNQRNCDQ